MRVSSANEQQFITVNLMVAKGSSHEGFDKVFILPLVKLCEHSLYDLRRRCVLHGESGRNQRTGVGWSF
jgi:hypothetical protein